MLFQQLLQISTKDTFTILHYKINSFLAHMFQFRIYNKKTQTYLGHELYQH